MFVVERLTRLDPAWKFALGTVAAARLLVSAWAMAVSVFAPVVLQNVNLFGSPVLAAFDLASSRRYVYSRQVQGIELTFRSAEPGFIVDTATSSVWSLDDGRAVKGKYLGNELRAGAYSVEDIFPYAGVAPSPSSVLGLWERFDANWYLKIAERGYAAADGSIVYFPLYPILIRLLGSLFIGNAAASLVISTLALLGACFLLYRIASELVGPNAARRAVVFLLIFPTSFFLLAGYTESLFLLLSLGSLYAGMRGRWTAAGILGALAALTRLQGVLLIVPLAFAVYRAAQRQSNGSIRRAAPLLLIPLGTAAFLGWQYLFLGNASLVGAYEGQLHARFVLPWDNVAAMLALIAGGSASFVDWLNLAATLLFGVLIVLCWRLRWMPRELTLFALVMYLAPLFRMTTMQPLVSMTRYVVVLFPIFIALGVWGKNAWIQRAIVYLSLPLALYLSAQFVMWGWVG